MSLGTSVIFSSTANVGRTIIVACFSSTFFAQRFLNVYSSSFQVNHVIVIDALNSRFEDISKEIERGVEAIRLVTCELLAQDPTPLPFPLQRQLHELLRQCAYLLDASSLARVRLTAVNDVRSCRSLG